MRVRRQPHLTLDDHFRAVATGTPLRDGHETDRAGLTLVDACRALLAAAPSQPVADAIFSRVDRAGLVDAVAAMERLAPRRRTVRATSSSPGAVRRYLPLLLDTLDFYATDAGEPILDALDALRRTARQRRLTPQELRTELIPRHWRPLVEPEPGRIDRAAYTMCALEALRDGLRRRDVYVARSERYGDSRASLLDAPARNASRSDVYRSLSLPETPEPFLERLGAELDAAYRRTLEGLHAEHPVHELANGRLPVEQFDALPEPPSLLALRDQVDRHLPDADLPDLLLEITAKTGFIDGFTAGPRPRVPRSTGRRKMSFGDQASHVPGAIRTVTHVRRAGAEGPCSACKSAPSLPRLSSG